jgi:hypothetical protein
MIPPRRRCRFSLPNADDLSPAQIYQQLLLARDDIHVRDRALATLQLQLTALECSLQQILTSSSNTLMHHVTLLEHTMAQYSQPASKLQVANAHSQRLDEPNQQIRSGHGQLVAQSKEVDSIVRDIIPRLAPYLNYFYRLMGSDLHQLFDKLLHQRPQLRPPKYQECRPNFYG